MGVDLSEIGVSPAMRLRVADYDGPPVSASAPWLDVQLSDGLDRLVGTTSTLAASATGDPVDTVVSTVVIDSIVAGSVLDPVAISATGGDGRVVVILTRMPGAP